MRNLVLYLIFVSANSLAQIQIAGGKLDVKGFGDARWGMTAEEIAQATDGRAVRASKKQWTAYKELIVPLGSSYLRLVEGATARYC